MKISVILISLFLGIGMIVMLFDKFSTKQMGSIEFWLLPICVLFMLPITLFMVPTHRINLDGEGITVTWQIGFGKFALYRYHECTPWKDVRAVINVLNVWLPFHLIWVNTIWIGSFMTHKKDALLYIADHVDEKVLDDEVKKLVRKYRKQKEKKQKGKAKN